MSNGHLRCFSLLAGRCAEHNVLLWKWSRILYNMQCRVGYLCYYDFRLFLPPNPISLMQQKHVMMSITFGLTGSIGTLLAQPLTESVKEDGRWDTNTNRNEGQ
jgi:hypothetical protein